MPQEVRKNQESDYISNSKQPDGIPKVYRAVFVEHYRVVSFFAGEPDSWG